MTNLGYLSTMYIDKVINQFKVMMHFRWNEEKNQWLAVNRSICFEELIHNGQILCIRPNMSKNHLGQEKLIIQLDGKMYAVPFVLEKDGTMFLKTAFRDRKLDREFLNNKA